jgi:hypothetical protein
MIELVIGLVITGPCECWFDDINLLPSNSYANVTYILEAVSNSPEGCYADGNLKLSLNCLVGVLIAAQARLAPLTLVFSLYSPLLKYANGE